MSSKFFDDEDVDTIEAPAQESFFDSDDKEDESIPMGGEMGLSDIVTEEYTAPSIDEPPLPELTQSEAALEGAKQGLTFGFADELGGATQESMDWLYSLFGDSPTEVSKQLAEEGFTGDLGPTSGEELYEEATAEGRRRLAAAEEQHPGTTMAADIGASMLMPIPGAGAARAGAKVLSKAAPKIAKGLKGATKAVAPKGISKVTKGEIAGGTAGALEAAGRTEEDLTTLEGIQDVATGGVLGKYAGMAGGKLAKYLEPEEAAKRGREALETAEDEALHAAGIKPKKMEEQIERQMTSGDVEGPGVTSLEEGIVSPMIQPKAAHKKALDVKKKLSEGYEAVTEKFTGRSNLGEPQANVIAEKQALEIMEAVEDAVAKTDDITEMAEKKLRNDISTLKEELVFAYTSDNPVRELQELYVKHNDKFFNNLTSGSAQARKTLRTKLKDIQRNHAKVINPEAYDEFAALDKKYSDIMDIEEITRRTAALPPKGAQISDLSRGIIAEMITKIPGISGPVTAGSIATKKLMGKDITQVVEAAKAQRSLKKARKLEEAAEDPSKVRTAIADAPEVTGAAPAAAGAAVTEAFTDEDKTKPTHLHKRTARMMQRATPEQLAEHATSIREEFGEKGERLAEELEGMAEKNKMQRTATMFKIMQNPQYKRMLMPDLFR